MPDGSVVRLTYNEAGLLDGVSANVRAAAEVTEFVTNIDYDAKGQRQRIAYGNGTETTYTHDPETFRLTQLRTTRVSDDRTLQDLRYTYDPVGNIAEIGDAAQADVFFNNVQVTAQRRFVYDALYRLTEATGREHATVGATQRDHADPVHAASLPADGQALRRYTETFGYDVVGNILRHQHVANNGGSWTRRYQYDHATAGNRLLATSLPGDVEGQFSATYSHDAHGNMTAMPHLNAMTWDFADRMASATSTVNGGGVGPRTFFAYDGGGARVRKVQRVSATRANERIYMGVFEIYREHVGLEVGNAALDLGAVAVERETLHISDDARRLCMVETRTVADGAEVEEPANVERYQYGDHLGSATLELDGAGQTISYEEFHPYGTSAYRAANTGVEVSAKRYRYVGKERDEETGLYLMGARYYACWLGRWTASDPIGLGDGVNRYAYVSGNPVGLRDPSGTQAGPPEELPDFHSEGVSDEEFEREGNEQGDANTRQGIPVGSARDKAVSSLRLLREGLGLRLEALEETLSAVDVEEAANNETTSIFGVWVTVKLERNVISAVFDIPRGLVGEERLADQRLLPLSELGTLVHEATHAFLLSEQVAESVLTSAEKYYEGAPIVGGGVVRDAKLAAQEAAATYVAAQVTSLLEAHNDLVIAAQGLANGGEYGLEIAPRKIQSARELLDQDLRNRDFGYVNVDGRQTNIKKRVSPKLAKFLDDRVLGGALSEARARLRRRVENLEGQVLR